MQALSGNAALNKMMAMAAPARAKLSSSSPKSAAVVLVVRRRSSSTTSAAQSSRALAASSASSPASSLTPSGPSSPRATSQIKNKRIQGGSLAHSGRKAGGESLTIAASASSSPQPWPAATANVFAPGPQHYAAVVVSSLKWLWATVAILLAADVTRIQVLALGATASAAAAPWTPWALRALGTNLIMAAGCAASLQRLLETGLAARVPAGPALAMGLLGAAVFRVVHLFGYRAAYAPAFFNYGVAVAGTAAVVLVALLAHLSSEKKKQITSASSSCTTLASLVPASNGLPAAYSLVALLYVGIGLALQVVPGSATARFFSAGSSIASSQLAEALRAAIGSTLVFPASVGAWVLKDAAEKGQLAWPSNRALNLGLLLSSLARVGVVAGAAASGTVLSSEAIWQVPVALHLVVALVAAAGLKSK